MFEFVWSLRAFGFRVLGVFSGVVFLTRKKAAGGVMPYTTHLISVAASRISLKLKTYLFQEVVAVESPESTSCFRFQVM